MKVLSPPVKTMNDFFAEQQETQSNVISKEKQTRPMSSKIPKVNCLMSGSLYLTIEKQTHYHFAETPSFS